MTPDPDAGDPFDILGIPPIFDIDPAALARAYLSLAARLHPDLARGDESAATRSAGANRARAILENPELRAGALLQRLGGPGKESDRSLPPGFLAEIMETREAIESAAASQDPDLLDQWRAWAADQRKGHTARASDLFRRHASAPVADRPAILRDIRLELNAWRYVERLIEQLEPGDGPSHSA